MKYEVVPNSCRICLRKCKKLRSIYKPLEDGDETPNRMLKLITGITVEESTDENELPKNICKACELSLNLAFQFRSKALKSQRIIEIFCSHRSSFKSENIVTSGDPFRVLKNETNTPDVKQEDSLKLSQLETDLNGEEQINSSNEMKVEDLEMPFSDDAKIEYLEDDSYDDEFDAIYSSADEEPLDILLTGIKSAIDSDKLQTRSCAKKLENIEQLDTELDSLDILLETKESEYESQNENQRATKKQPSGRRGRKPKYDIDELQQRLIDSDKYSLVEAKDDEPDTSSSLKLIKKKSGRPKANNETSHICDICGNIYAKRGRMMEHRRRHDKELRFACELCDKRFHLREKLRKHMFSHSGGKPFQCSFCSRSFFYESVKKAHEAVHNGVKPYVCEICNKAFAYSHALKKHKLIHADIKLYHCEYCDKDFRLQHHMKQHEETKMHQNAVKSAEASRAEITGII